LASLLDLEARLPPVFRREPRRRELLIDCEEDRALRAVLVGKLRETGR
jgi:hypothetical protein